MRRWLVFASVALALLFVGGIAGDVFFVHHHLDAYSLAVSQESHYSTGYLGSTVFFSTLLFSSMVLGVIIWRFHNKAVDKAVQYFRGWNNSAYDEGHSIRNCYKTQAPRRGAWVL